MPSLRNLPPPSPWRPLSEAQAKKVEAVSGSLLARLEFVTDRRLQKAYYLAEVWFIEERLNRLTGVDFASWKHGPWSLHVRESIERLERQGYVERIEKTARRGPETEFLRVSKATPAEGLSADEIAFLEDVTNQLKFLNSEKLTQVAKETRPYRSTPPASRIDLDAYLESLLERHSKLADSSKVAAMVAAA